MTLSKKHQLTLKRIFQDPIRSDIEWKQIEKLLIALGAEISEGKGSRVRIYLNGIRAVFHRPHPQKETDKGALRSIRRFLNETGVQ
jgi:predicted RNA binding protein YcfA (HicA-like mRNA interferase family)